MNGFPASGSMGAEALSGSVEIGKKLVADGCTSKAIGVKNNMSLGKENTMSHKYLHSLTLLLCAVGVASVAVIGCGKNLSPTDSQSAITEDDAADVVAASMGGSSSSEGLSAQLKLAAELGSGPTAPDAPATIDGITFDTTIVRQAFGLGYSYRYTYYISYLFSNLGNTLDLSYAMKGVYDLPRMSSDDSANAVLNLNHIVDSNATLTVNGSYLRLGSQQFKVRDQLSITSQITMSLTNVEVDKFTKLIQSGTATVSISVQASNGRSFSRTGTITFDGNQRATLLLGARLFILDLIRGEAEAG